MDWYRKIQTIKHSGTEDVGKREQIGLNQRWVVVEVESISTGG